MQLNMKVQQMSSWTLNVHTSTPTHVLKGHTCCRDAILAI